MTIASVIAAADHGPGMHGGVIGTVALVLVIAVGGGLWYRRSRSNRGHDPDRHS